MMLEQNKILTAAIIGCGSIAQKKHLSAIKENGGVEVVAFCDTNRQNALDAKQIFGSDRSWIADGPEDIFKDKSIDLVYICTPNQSHAQLSIQALNSGKHVLCEKPMALCAKDAYEMVAAAEESKRVLQIAFQNRFNDDSIMLKELCEDGYFGNIYHIKAYAVRKRAIPTWGVFLNKELQGGGPLIDIGSHALDLALWVTDNYKPAYVCGKIYDRIARRGSNCNRWGSWQDSAFTVEDSAFGLVVMEDGTTITIDAAWALNTSDEREACISVYGDAAGAEMRGNLTLVTEMGGRLMDISASEQRATRAMAMENNKETPAQREADLFIDAVRAGDLNKSNAIQAAAVTAIIDALYISSETGRPFIFD